MFKPIKKEEFLNYTTEDKIKFIRLLQDDKVLFSRTNNYILDTKKVKVIEKRRINNEYVDMIITKEELKPVSYAWIVDVMKESGYIIENNEFIKKDTSFLDLPIEKQYIQLNSLGINPHYYVNYVLYYHKIIKFMIDKTEGYCFLKQLGERYTEEVEKEMSLENFTDIVKRGADDSMFGIISVNNYNVVYLKKNAYICHYKKIKSGVNPKTITTKMLIKSLLLLNIDKDLERLTVSGVKSKNIYINKELEYGANTYRKDIYIITTTNSLFTDTGKLYKFINKLIEQEIEKDTSNLTLHIVSPVKVQDAVINNSKKYLGIITDNTIDAKPTVYVSSKVTLAVTNDIYDVSKYFYGMPLDVRLAGTNK